MCSRVSGLLATSKIISFPFKMFILSVKSMTLTARFGKLEQGITALG